ncbi:MAG TPA: hypothetical protein VF497_02035 [Rudaea sp.]
MSIAVAALGSAQAPPALADQPQDNGSAEVSAAQHGELHSLRGAMPRPDDFSKSPREHKQHPLPWVDGPGQPNDPVVQTSAGPAAPTFGSGVDGVGNGFSGPQGTFTVDSAPPDTNGAVGATQYVQIVNSGFAVFDKTSKSAVYGPVPTNTLWQGFGGPCQSDNDGDATVVYDKAAGRWVISQFAVTAAPYYECVAVSKTADATGGYWLYAFPYGSVFPDYPKMGVWPDAYYETFNMFNGNTFAGAKLCAYDRNSMLNGLPATQQCFQLSSSYGGVLPADMDGSTAPPAGAPNYLFNFGTGKLNEWKFHIDWNVPGNTKLTGPVSIPVAAFSAACSGGTCIPQSGTSQKLDSLADRLMFRVGYRNFTDHESLVITHSVTAGNKRTSPSGVRWYEIRSPGAAAPTVYQQSTYAPDSSYRWMGSLAMDKQGNIALGYSVSSSTMHPAIRYTGRLAGDTLNTMQSETSIVAGTGSQSGSNLSRWGDYSAMTIDPSDDCTFWYTNEYLKTTGAFNWSTRIASLKFAGCQ